MRNFFLKVFFVILAFLIIPIKRASSQDEYILYDIKKSESDAFTQGLELNEDGQIVMATGLYGESKIGILDQNSGQFNTIDQLDDYYFGEGITFTPDALWQLTWKENTVFKRDPDTYDIIDILNYEGEGWGLAYDDKLNIIWMSDGSHIIQKRNSKDFELIDTIEIYFNNLAVENINELEYANGYLYANVWYTNKIIAINTITGEIDYQYDMTELISNNLSKEQLESIDTLNGIAHIRDNRFYITGKYYPVIFEVELKR
ncbi:glutaminyl-peptide cyclotransferase [Aerococcaceae bacterium WGS1372]